MRIVSGSLGGRTFDAPKGHRTHPMSDKVRGAIFNILGDVSDQTVLDAYSGSGALGIEALSRGATSVIFIDADASAVGTIKRNLELLGLAKSGKATKANITGWSNNNSNKRFDLVLADPPYDHVAKDQLIPLAHHAKIGGLVVFSLPPRHTITLPDNFTLQASKNYGDATLVFYKRIQ